LDRGTRMEMIKVFGQPVYTLAIGLGVRLPLHGNLGASPAAILAPRLPEPITYWLLLTIAMGTAAFIVRHALEPICGRLLSWFAIFLLLFSLPLINYTISDDWPETAVTYFTIIASVFVPHALLSVSSAPISSIRRRLGTLSLLALFSGAMAISHPGYWPLIAPTLVSSAALVAIRTDHPLRNRLAVVASLGVVAVVVVALLAPDVVREVVVAGKNLEGMRRFTEGSEGYLWRSNLLLDWGARRPFTFLLMTVTCLTVGLGCLDRTRFKLTTGSALASLVFGIAASTFSPGSLVFAPSTTWALRDPAIGFAVLSAACAAASLNQNRITRIVGVRTWSVVLLLGALLGPLAAAGVIFREGRALELFDRYVAPRGTTPPQERISARGLPPERIAVGSRIALGPGVAQEMRRRGRAQADFPAAGYELITATTKQRTMRGLVEPNDTLFAQSTDLPATVLCNPTAVSFLQLNYLLAASTTDCHPWHAVVPRLVVDQSFIVHAPREVDTRVHAVQLATISEAVRRTPAFSSASSLLSTVTPLADTSLTLGPKDIVIRQPRPASDRTLLLPVAYDAAWVASSGTIENIGGLVAVNGAHDAQIVLSFVPDLTAILRSVAMVLSQLFTCLGLVGLACLAPVATPSAIRIDVSVRRNIYQFGLWLRQLRYWPDPVWVTYCGVMFFTLKWYPEDRDETSLAVALLLPATVFVVTRLGRQPSVRKWIGDALLITAVGRVLMRGSLAYQALHDPLFWAIIATAAFGVSLVAARRPRIAHTAAAVAGATAMLATMLPLFPKFDSEFPNLALDTIRASLDALTYQLGTIGTTLLLLLWARAMVQHAIPWQRLSRTSLMARAALLIALLLCLAGAVPSPTIDPLSLVTLGMLIGLSMPGGHAIKPIRRDERLPAFESTPDHERVRKM
jgi:hypothetical protein